MDIRKQINHEKLKIYEVLTPIFSRVSIEISIDIVGREFLVEIYCLTEDEMPSTIEKATHALSKIGATVTRHGKDSFPRRVWLVGKLKNK